MSGLRLNDRSFKAFRRSRALFIGGGGSFLASLSLGQVAGVPGLVSVSMGTLGLAGFVASFIVSSRIRCPGCEGRVLWRMAPSWYRTPRVKTKDCIRCAQCHELIDVSGPDARPSSTSLEPAG